MIASGDVTMRVKPARRILAQPVAKGFTILNLETGQYYELEGTAALIWQGLNGTDSAETIAARLAHTFNVDRAMVLRDVLDLVDNLRTAGLVIHH